MSLGHQMPVDIVGDLPALPAGASPGAGGDTVGDQMDARWFSRGTAASGGSAGGRLTESASLASCLNQKFRVRFFCFCLDFESQARVFVHTALHSNLCSK